MGARGRRCRRASVSRIQGGVLPVAVLVLAEVAHVCEGSLYAVTRSNDLSAAGVAALTVSVAGANFGSNSNSFLVCVRVCLSACCMCTGVRVFKMSALIETSCCCRRGSFRVWWAVLKYLYARKALCIDILTMCLGLAWRTYSVRNVAVGVRLIRAL